MSTKEFLVERKVLQAGYTLDQNEESILLLKPYRWSVSSKFAEERLSIENAKSLMKTEIIRAPSFKIFGNFPIKILEESYRIQL